MNEPMKTANEHTQETVYERKAKTFPTVFVSGNMTNPINSLAEQMRADCWGADQTQQSPDREAMKIEGIMKAVLGLCAHFTAWETARKQDMEWKRSIEAELRKTVREQTQILQSVEDKLDELLNGDPQGQSKMFNLLLSTLNDLRERITTLENGAASRRPSERRPPASGKS